MGGRFDIVEGTSAIMAEYANAFLYADRGVRPNHTEFRGPLPAIGLMINPPQSATTGR
ncbi:hypothetical protein [Streptomyces griseus]|uniref:hypothetical protein n=1 Tax=Streptomyces griseus TaxID=1911 RepID=UPI0034474FBE